MKKLAEKFRSFMYGRNGNDSLNQFIFFWYIVVFIVYLFTQFWPLLILETIVMILFFFRIFSKNLSKREKENNAYLHFFDGIKKFFIRQAHKMRDHKTHVYKKCPSCKKVLRLKKVKGEHSVKCPICGNHFDIKI